ncbi:hypothetical protein [Lysinibacillus sp. ZYM-1]|uniref:hypothetical protein n=1 Tax=Lysinibacillus sp. ZYM-1 TaxID=1681184 RepID=UPI0006CE6B7D|nr:hypothetical protein [Lysinibacillus sp. ZYM-1]KPN96228.1 hypothetical protein AO843_18130 [Lysinibacillus sp. ZYM-1]
MKRLSVIYCEANGECLVMKEFKDTTPVLPNVGDRVGLENAFYKVVNRDFIYTEETNTVEVYIYLDN